MDDYKLWATARLAILDRDRLRPMSPKDLNSRELREWQQNVDACETMKEAIMVVSATMMVMMLVFIRHASQTEEVFGTVGTD